MAVNSKNDFPDHILSTVGPHLPHTFKAVSDDFFSQAALQRHAAAVEALERKSLAEALLEREKAIFKRFSTAHFPKGPGIGWHGRKLSSLLRTVDFQVFFWVWLIHVDPCKLPCKQKKMVTRTLVVFL